MNKSLTILLSNKIKKNKKNHSQKAIANALGISESYLSLMLSGKKPIPKRLRPKLKELAYNGNNTVSKN